MNHAIVAAVSRYPRWPGRDLDGPINDLIDVGRWLLDPHGGRIRATDAPEFFQWMQDPTSPAAPLRAKPGSAIQFFVSPQDTQQPDDDPVPDAGQVELALEGLHRQGTLRRKTTGNPRLGDRLFLYFAGHGFGPDRSETALFLADAEPSIPGKHVVGRAYANHFVESQFFGDVMLIMDCCRSDGLGVPLRPMPFLTTRGPTAPAPTKPFCAFATSYEQASREEPGPPARGIFTRLLMEGLRGAAPRENGVITAKKLELWLLDRIKTANQQPEFDFDRSATTTHVLATPAPKPPNLTVVVGGDGAGTPTVEGGPDQAKSIPPTTSAAPRWSYTLEPGLYVVRLPGTTRKLYVEDSMLGGPDVVL